MLNVTLVIAAHVALVRKRQVHSHREKGRECGSDTELTLMGVMQFDSVSCVDTQMGNRAAISQNQALWSEITPDRIGPDIVLKSKYREDKTDITLFDRELLHTSSLQIHPCAATTLHVSD
jgi:hypothetical protein